MQDTKTHSNNNRCHSERDCHRSTTTQLWNADTSMPSNHTEVSDHCCHGKHTVASSRTLLSCLVNSVSILVVPKCVPFSFLSRETQNHRISWWRSLKDAMKFIDNVPVNPAYALWGSRLHGSGVRLIHRTKRRRLTVTWIFLACVSNYKPQFSTDIRVRTCRITNRVHFEFQCQKVSENIPAWGLLVAY
jgi:hypothetical protein